MPEIKIETTLNVPEGFEYTGEFRKARKGDFIYEQPLWIRQWIHEDESSLAYHIFRKKPPTHGKILESVGPLDICGYIITAYDVYGVQRFAELEKLIPVGYEAVSFGIPRKGDDYLSVSTPRVESCSLDKMMYSNTGVAYNSITNLSYNIRPRLILRKVTA